MSFREFILHHPDPAQQATNAEAGSLLQHAVLATRFPQDRARAREALQSWEVLGLAL
jgi:hypothetical protein